MSNRRGFSLIELVAAIGAISILAGLSVMLIQSLMRVERVERAALVHQASLARLSHEFRRDVHAASSAVQTPKETERLTQLVLKLPSDETVEYQIQSNKVTRTRRAATQKERRESFELHTRGTASIKVQTVGGQTVVSLVVDRRLGKSGQGAARELRVDAIAGRDHRFETKKD